jgi:hypothetical protein
MSQEFHTNIKNLPEGEYVTALGYSDTHPFKIIAKTACTVEVVAVETETDPEWIAKREFYPGGFFGHTANQNQQTWIFKGLGKRKIRLRRNKKGQLVNRGERYAENRAVRFYDYNF